MLVDTHAHLDFPDYAKDQEEVIKRASSFNVTKIINIGTSLANSQQSIDLADKYSQIFATVGVHPNDGVDLLKKMPLKQISEQIKKLTQQDKVVGIGECGLDYYRLKDNKDKDIQKKLFIQHLEIAQELDLPVVIHCRASQDNHSDAYQDILKILKKYQVRGVAHSFAGQLVDLSEFLKRGFYISFNGIITFTKKNDNIIELVNQTPLEKILLETDCPFLTPEPHRGKRNEPGYVKYVAEKLAELKGVSFEEVEKQTTENAETLFVMNNEQ